MSRLGVRFVQTALSLRLLDRLRVERTREPVERGRMAVEGGSAARIFAEENFHTTYIAAGRVYVVETRALVETSVSHPRAEYVTVTP
jgi:hypothetical protein